MFALLMKVIPETHRVISTFLLLSLGQYLCW